MNFRIPLACAAAVAALAGTPAHAAGVGNIGYVVDTQGSGTHQVTGTCSFMAMLPSTGWDSSVSIVYAAAAHSSGVAVSTSVICTLRPAPDAPLNYGSIGVTTPGTEAAIAGSTFVPRNAPGLYGCVLLNAAFLDGTTATNSPHEVCASLSSGA